VTTTRPEISIIIPTLNEESALPATLDALARLDSDIEVIVADGGSSDRTVELAATRKVRVIGIGSGRGLQLDAGARAAKGAILWFLHADTQVPSNSVSSIRGAFGCPGVVGGNFQLVFSGGSRAARTLTRIYPHLALLGLTYGDSGIFVRRDIYLRIGGFRHYPLFEDLDFVTRLRRYGQFVRVDSALITSSRRFEGRGLGCVFARWTLLQTLYWAGVNPTILARYSAPVREQAAGKRVTTR
jgi:rSAM/selenodomain-associated transferase 2